jgi:hypothetical protein
MNLNDINLLYEFNYWAKARMLGAVDCAFGRIALQRFENKLRDSPRHARPHLRRGRCLAAKAHRNGQSEIPYGSRLAGLQRRQSKMAGGRERDAYLRSFPHRRTAFADIYILKHQRRTGEQRVVAGAPASRQPWHLPPRANHLDDSAARRNAGEHRPDRILPAKKVTGVRNKKSRPALLDGIFFTLDYCLLCYVSFFLFFFLRLFLFAVLVRIDKLQLFRFLVEFHLNLAAVAEFPFQNFLRDGVFHVFLERTA